MQTKAERAQELLWQLQSAYTDMDYLFIELKHLGYPLDPEERESWDKMSDTIQDLGNEIGEDLQAEEDERREEEEHDEGEEG